MKNENERPSVVSTPANVKSIPNIIEAIVQDSN